MHSIALLICANIYASKGKVHSSIGSFPLSEEDALDHTLLNRIGIRQSVYIILKTENRNSVIGTMQAYSKDGRNAQGLVHSCDGLNVSITGAETAHVVSKFRRCECLF